MRAASRRPWPAAIRTALRAASAAGFAALVLAATAQPSPAAEPPGDPYIVVSPRFGTANAVGLDLYLPAAPADITSVIDALSPALGCTDVVTSTELVPESFDWSEDAEDEEYDGVPAGWYLWSHCRDPVIRRVGALEFEATVALGPIFRSLQPAEITATQVYAGPLGPGTSLVEMPEGSRLVAPPWSVSAGRTYYHYEVPVSTDGASAIALHFGYGYGEILEAIAPLGGALMFPVLLTLLLARRARARSAGLDSARRWFRFANSVAIIRIGAWVAYVLAGYRVTESAVGDLALATVAERGRHYLAAAGSAALNARHVAFLALALALASFLPLLLVDAACGAIAERALSHARGATLTRRRAFAIAWWRDFAFVGSVLPAAIAVSLFTDSDYLQGLSWAVAAITLWIWARSLGKRLVGFDAVPISSGELYERVAGLAQKAAVKLRQIAVFQTGGSGVANAAAMIRGSLSISDHLVLNLDKREADWVIAHELGHLHRRHPRRLYFVWGACVAVVVLLQAAASSFHLTDIAAVPWLVSAAVVVAASLVIAHGSRSHEREADRKALQITGDPEAAISALAKLAELNVHPMDWGRAAEALSTHPSMARRIATIADAAGFGREKVASILANGLEYPSRVSYALPPGLDPAADPAKTELLTAKRTFLRRGRLAAYSVQLAPAVAIACLLDTYHRHAVALEIALYAFGLIGAFLGAVGIDWVVGIVWTVATRRLTFRFLRRQRSDLGDVPGVFSAISPGRYPRVFDGVFNAWAHGVSGIADGRLFFIGDRTSFVLTPTQIESISVAPAPPSVLQPRPAGRTFVQWSDPVSGRSGAFTLQIHDRPLSSKSDLSFRQTLIEWAQARGTPVPARPALGKLGPPDFDYVRGAPHSPPQEWGRREFVGLAWLGLLGLSAAALLGTSAPKALFAGAAAVLTTVLLGVPMALSDYKTWTDDSDGSHGESPDSIELPAHGHTPAAVAGESPRNTAR